MKKLRLIGQILSFACVGVAVVNTDINIILRWGISMIALAYLSFTNYKEGVDRGLEISSQVVNQLLKDRIFLVDEKKAKEKGHKVVPTRHKKHD